MTESTQAPRPACEDRSEVTAIVCHNTIERRRQVKKAK